MKTVLVVIHTPVFGGPHNQALRLAQPLKALGWRTVVLLPDEEGGAADRLAANGVSVIRIPLHRLRAKLQPGLQARYLRNFFPDVRRIASVLESEAVDVVQVCGVMNPQSAFAGHHAGVGVVWQLLSTYPPPLLRSAMMYLVTWLSGSVMSAGLNTAKAHRGWQRVQDRLVPFVPPVDVDLFRCRADTRKAARRLLGVPDDGFLVGTLGNLNKLKGHDVLLAAFMVLHTECPSAYLRILGSPTPTHAAWYDREVIGPALKAGLLHSGAAKFVDPMGQPEKFLPGFDAFVLSSPSEGLPTAMLEAMACGLPVIATQVGAVEEVVEHLVTGILVQPGMVEGFVQALRLLIQMGPEERASMGLRARGEAETKFSADACAEVHARAYAASLEYTSLRGLS